MSARKISAAPSFQTEQPSPQYLRLDLGAEDVRIRKNGIEFLTAEPIPVWTEMTVGIETPLDSRRVNFTGVVVACNGNRHEGFSVAMVFTELTRQAQARLNSLALSL
jgi:hypothetical protein